MAKVKPVTCEREFVEFVKPAERQFWREREEFNRRDLKDRSEQGRVAKQWSGSSVRCWCMVRMVATFLSYPVNPVHPVRKAFLLSLLRLFAAKDPAFFPRAKLGTLWKTFLPPERGGRSLAEAFTRKRSSV
jgi:hypothetical protein